ncbi:N-glycosylase/DNA lyase [Trametopsis cervina]|nr:N-glycosylase/DNA lyase [Trametopsis cervina]
MATVSTIAAGFRCLPLPVAQLSLDAVLQCGQSFRWAVFPLKSNDTPSREYRFCLRDRVVCLRQTPDTIQYRSVFASEAATKAEDELREAETLTWINDYFQLNVDLLELYEQWGTRDPVFHKLKNRFSGIRMLRQDPFECLLSFICSSNNNIGRITKMVKALCTEYSPALLSLDSPSELSAANGSPQTYHPFPSPSALAGPAVAARLRALGFGYRAEFIQKTAKMLVDAHGSVPSKDSGVEPAEEWLKTLRKLDTASARSELLKFVGVGRKVADCVLLMSLDKREVVPVDTHVHQIAVKHYGLSGSKTKAATNPALYEQVNTKLVGVWGEYAGWAHSVLFTSDLKAFSSYGISSTPSTVVAPRPASEASTLVASPTTSPRKRKVPQSSDTQSNIPEEHETLQTRERDPFSVPIDSSMADRVKRRRRGKAAPAE